MNEITAPIILILTIVMPGNMPDYNMKLPMPTIEECFNQARDWDDRGLTQAMKTEAVLGYVLAARSLVYQDYKQMAYDPMISALQGPQDPAMDALFSPPPQTGRRALSPLDLLIHGQERLKDPNIPAYDLGNTFKVTPPGTPTFPPPWGGGGRITQEAPVQHLQHVAGDVVPFPIDPQIADQRRMMHEDFMQEMHRRMGQLGIDQYRRMWPAAPVELGPGANE